MPKKKKANGRLAVVPDTVDIRQEEEPADAASADSENSIKPPPEKEAVCPQQNDGVAVVVAGVTVEPVNVVGQVAVAQPVNVDSDWGVTPTGCYSSRPGGSSGAGSTEQSCWRGENHPHTGFEGGRRTVDGINSSRRQQRQWHSKACSWQSGDNGGGENGGGCQCELASVP